MEHNARVRAQQAARELLLERWFPPDIDAGTEGLFDGTWALPDVELT